MKKTDANTQILALIVFVLFFLSNSGFGFTAQKLLPSSTDEQAILNRIDKPFKGDLGEIRKRRIIRVLVSYCKTNYFFDHGKPRGFEYELMKAYEKFLNRKEKNRYTKTKMILIPLPFDRILRSLDKGRGDIAAASLTITPERQKIVNFTKPYIPKVDEIVVLNKKGTLLGNILFKKYYQDSKWIKNPITEAERKKLTKLIDLFKKYGDQYHFDYLELTAQAYQESGLDNSKQSPTGAIGIMQVLPRTASDKHIKIKNIYLLENNIHAGTKYLNFLRSRYFSNPEISPADRVFFSWAAYNAGPAKIYNIRQETVQRGFNPNKWFFNVEKIASEIIGNETVDYVANINKYFVAYQLYFDIYQQRKKTMKSFHKN